MYLQISTEDYGNNSYLPNPITRAVESAEFTSWQSKLTSAGIVPGPDTSGWTKCADENGTCTFSGTMRVRYGANGTYNYQTATGSISCNNATFGDPLPGVTKACYVAPTGWTKCADQYGTCTFSGTMVVRYGASSSYNYQTATGSINCTNNTFGDPLPGSDKACSVAPVPATGWTKCADQYGVCAVSGTVTVAYGASSSYNYRTVTGSIDCNNNTFGDPLPGSDKSCYYL
jgi:hypothetical protein